MDILKELISNKNKLSQELEKVQKQIADIETAIDVFQGLFQKEALKNIGDDKTSLTIINEKSITENTRDASQYTNKKGNLSWKNYLLPIIESSDKKLGTDDLVKLTLANNPELSNTTTQSSIRNALWSLFHNNLIDREPKGSEKSHGYWYTAKKKPQ